MNFSGLLSVGFCNFHGVYNRFRKGFQTVCGRFHSRVFLVQIFSCSKWILSMCSRIASSGIENLFHGIMTDNSVVLDVYIEQFVGLKQYFLYFHCLHRIVSLIRQRLIYHGKNGCFLSWVWCYLKSVVQVLNEVLISSKQDSASNSCSLLCSERIVSKSFATICEAGIFENVTDLNDMDFNNDDNIRLAIGIHIDDNRNAVFVSFNEAERRRFIWDALKV